MAQSVEGRRTSFCPRCVVPEGMTMTSLPRNCRLPPAAKLVARGAADSRRISWPSCECQLMRPALKLMIRGDVVHHRQAQFLAGHEQVFDGERIDERGFLGRAAWHDEIQK